MATTPLRPRRALGLAFAVALLGYGLVPRAFFAGAWRSALPEEGRSATEVVRLQLTALQENNPEIWRRRRMARFSKKDEGDMV